MSDWVVYMLKLKNNALYTGITNNIIRRANAHISGKGSKYVRAHLPFEIVYAEMVENRSTASKRESKIKKMTKGEKVIMINSAQDGKTSLFCENCGVVISLSDSTLTPGITEYPCVVCGNEIVFSYFTKTPLAGLEEGR